MYLNGIIELVSLFRKSNILNVIELLKVSKTHVNKLIIQS